MLNAVVCRDSMDVQGLAAIQESINLSLFLGESFRITKIIGPAAGIQ